MEFNIKHYYYIFDKYATKEEKEDLESRIRRLKDEIKEVVAKRYIENYTVQDLNNEIEETIFKQRSLLFGDQKKLRGLSFEELTKEFCYIYWRSRMKDFIQIDEDNFICNSHNGYLKVFIDRVWNEFDIESITEEEYNNYCITVDEYCDAMVKVMEDK